MDPMKDPLHDRFLQDLPAPPSEPISRELLYKPGTTLPNSKELQSHLHKEGRVSKLDCLQIVNQTTNLLLSEKNLLELMDPVTIVGDIHGQFYDLLRIFELGGNIEDTKYLFLGDYVDRGSFSVEVILLLYSLKLNYPDRIFLLRGNHECRQMSSFFNFRAECLHKFDIEVYDAIMNSFDAMPIACIVNNKFIAVHGGISPELTSMQDIIGLQRVTEPPRSGLFCDLLWSDPVDNDSGQLPERFKANDVRGCSYCYGSVAVNAFLKKSKLLSVLRAHEVQIDGYKMHKWNGSTGFPVVITIFSAPNYCDVYNNKGAVVKFNNNVLNIQQYNYTVHPYILPNFMDIFSWSIPFVIEKVMEMLYEIIKIDETNTPNAKNKNVSIAYDHPKAEIFRNKVRAVSKMMKMLKTLREDKEVVLQLKGLCPDNKIPRGLLQLGRDAMVGAVDAFKQVKEWDIRNERRPNN